MLEGLTGFTIILVVAVAVALIIMSIGNDLAPKSPDTPGKLAPYTCGEDIAPTRARITIADENSTFYLT